MKQHPADSIHVLNDWLTPREIRKILRVGVNQPYRMKKQGLFKGYIKMVGERDWRVHRSYLEVKHG